MPEKTLDQQASSPKRILGFDFGTTKMGIAIGQSLTGSATPLAPIKAKDGVPDWQVIAKLIEEWQPDAIVVGVPLNMDGSDNDITRRARRFCNRLHGRFRLPCFGMDERLSTRNARSQMAEQDGSYDVNTSIDSYAAKLIIESWLRQQTL